MGLIDKLKLAEMLRVLASVVTPQNLKTFFTSKTCWALLLSLLGTFAHTIWTILAPALPGMVADGLRAVQHAIPPQYSDAGGTIIAVLLFLVGVWGRMKPKGTFVLPSPEPPGPAFVQKVGNDGK